MNLDDPWQEKPAATAAEAFDVEACFQEEFEQAANSLLQLQKTVWLSMVGHFGPDLALQLAPTLLRPLVEAAQREAAERLTQRMQLREMRKQKQLLAQQSMRPW